MNELMKSQCFLIYQYVKIKLYSPKKVFFKFGKVGCFCRLHLLKWLLITDNITTNKGIML